MITISGDFHLIGIACGFVLHFDRRLGVIEELLMNVIDDWVKRVRTISHTNIIKSDLVTHRGYHSMVIVSESLYFCVCSGKFRLEGALHPVTNNVDNLEFFQTSWREKVSIQLYREMICISIVSGISLSHLVTVIIPKFPFGSVITTEDVEPILMSDKSSEYESSIPDSIMIELEKPYIRTDYRRIGIAGAVPSVIEDGKFIDVWDHLASVVPEVPILYLKERTSEITGEEYTSTPTTSRRRCRTEVITLIEDDVSPIISQRRCSDLKIREQISDTRGDSK